MLQIVIRKGTNPMHIATDIAKSWMLAQLGNNGKKVFAFNVNGFAVVMVYILVAESSKTFTIQL